MSGAGGATSCTIECSGSTSSELYEQAVREATKFFDADVRLQVHPFEAQWKTMTSAGVVLTWTADVTVSVVGGDS